MAEVIAVGASVIAIIQIADRLITLCKSYIEAVHNAPSDLRVILIETSTVKVILQNLQFLISCNSDLLTLDGLSGGLGPIEGCRKAITELERLFPPEYAISQGDNGSKRRKARLALTALAWPLKQNKARELLREMIEYKTSINLALTIESTHDIKQIKHKTTEIFNALTGSQRNEVYKWLQVTDTSPIHHRVYRQYESGTGDWILRSPDWIHWIEGKERCLWIYGIPGAGKTVLVSHIIEKLKERGKDIKTQYSYAYYYCYFGHSQDEASPFLRSIINQFCRQLDLIPPSLYRLYRVGGHPSLVELLQVLEEIMKAIDDSVYVIIDAIDESMPREEIIKVLRDLVTDLRFQKLQLLITSRQYIDIEKFMEPVSMPLSMLNHFVDEDIRIYVRSRLDKNPKFSHWSSKIRREVEEALSSGAKGMFRWAACQLDVLQRLKGDSSIIRNALANLPKTLDETYERIFQSISEEDCLFVRHVLEWIYYHNEVYGDSISCHVLLHAVERSSAKSNPVGRAYHYNEELLRELCGCLITIMPTANSVDGDVHRGVSFAHYTVWEFLSSERIWNNRASFFAMKTETIILECTKIVLLETINIPSNKTWEDVVVGASFRRSFPLENFSAFSAASSIIALRKWGQAISKQNELSRLAFDTLDLSMPHSRPLKAIARELDKIELFDIPEIDYSQRFWLLRWKTQAEYTKASLLINLFYLDLTCELAKKFLESINIEEVMQTHLEVKVETYYPPGRGDQNQTEFDFDGTIIELFAQLAMDKPDPFKTLLKAGAQYIDPSAVFISFISSHSHHRLDHTCESFCLLLKLLQLGADVNKSGLWVTPLQIAVARLDLAGVRVLLEAGAEPNSIGDRNAPQWNEDSLLGRFNDLRGLLPLSICREREDVDHCERDNVDHREDIEVELLRYGASEFEMSPRSDTCLSEGCIEINY